MKRRIGVFLDRDGVICKLVNDHGVLRSPRSMPEFQFVDGVIEFLDRLRELDIEVAVVTNQPEVKRNLVRKELVEQFHQMIRERTGIEHFFVCWHDDDDTCNCRKPKPGLLFQAAEELGVDLSGSYMLGDRQKDMDAARAAGCRGILVGRDGQSVKAGLYGFLDSLYKPAH